MKTDIVLYERIYQLIRSQIECGLLPEGSKLPSRADLCEEFHVSAKTVRSAVERLAEEGLIETSQRKLAVVRGSVQAEEKHDNAYLLVDKASVSYTHLDVYKRQPIWIAAGRSKHYSCRRRAATRLLPAVW